MILIFITVWQQCARLQPLLSNTQKHAASVASLQNRELFTEKKSEKKTENNAYVYSVNYANIHSVYATALQKVFNAKNVSF